ncbi:MAG TPA: CBS domain-containing protein [Candidatus Dormibacteraeota bacterium]|jgi:CBS domain-containing protein|nr:CBS domain-containing protein [Candidatus Dormibacteraeota bacterium]
MKRTRVSDVMTSPVVTVGPETGFKEIVVRLRQHGISAVPVAEPTGRVVGVVSEADLLLKEERAGTEPRRRFFRRGEGKAAGTTAAELMTAPAVTVEPQAPIWEAARLMHHHGVKRLPVVNEAGQLVGIVSRCDLLSVFVRDDEEIRHQIVEDLILRTLLLDPQPVEVEVHDGVVHLSGQVDRRSDAQLIARMSRQVDGVVEVRSRLTYRYDDTELRPAGPPPVLWRMR